MGNSMWRNDWSTLQYYVKYIHNNIVKTSRVRIIKYTERVCDMHDLAK